MTNPSPNTNPGPGSRWFLAGVKHRAPLLLCLTLALCLLSLSFGSSLLISAAACACSVAATAHYVPRRKALLATSCFLAGLAALLLFVGTARQYWIQRDFARFSASRMEDLAAAVQRSMDRLLTSVDAQARRGVEKLHLLGPAGISSAGIRSQDPPDVNAGSSLAYVDPEGVMKAWSGDIPLLRDTDLPRGTDRFIVRKAKKPYLYRCLHDPTTGWRVVAGRRLDPDSLAVPDRNTIRISFVDSSDDTEVLGRRFGSTGDRLWVDSLDGTTSLHLPLRALQDKERILAVVTVMGQKPSEVLADADGKIALTASLILALSLCLAALHLFRCVHSKARPGPGSLPAFAGFIAAVFLVRYILYVHLPLEAPAFHHLLSPDRFASMRLFGLLRSPGDIFLTAFASLLVVLVASRQLLAGLREQPQSLRRFEPAMFFAAPAVSLCAVLWFQSFLAEVVRNTDLDLLDFSFIEFHPPVFCVKAGLVALFATIVLLPSAALFLPVHGGSARRPALGRALVAGGLWLLWPVLFVAARNRLEIPDWFFTDAASRSVSVPLVPSILIYLLPIPIALWAVGRAARPVRSHRFLSAAKVASLLVVLPAVLYLSILHHDFRNRQALIRNTLRPAVTAQQSARRFALQHILETVTNGFVDRLQPGPIGELAFSIWSNSPLSAYGYASAVEVFDEGGALRSSFYFNLPVETRPAYDWSPGLSTVDEETFVQGERRTRVIRGTKALVLGREQRFTVVFWISEGYDDLPFFRRQGRLHDLILSEQSSYVLSGLAGTPLILLVFDESGNVLHATPLNAPVLDVDPRNPKGLFDPPAWMTAYDDRGKTDLFLFSHDARLFAAGFKRKNLREHAVDLINLVLVCLMLGALARIALLAATAELSIFSPVRIIQAFTSRFSRKLFVALLAVAVIPMILLSFYLKGYVYSSKVKEIEESARSSMETARNIIEAYLSTLKDEPGEPLDGVDDSLLIWVAGLVHHDLTLYRGRELHATSIRGLYVTETLPSLVDGLVFQEIYDARKSVVLLRKRLNGLLVLEVNVPITLDGGRPAGILSLAGALSEEDIRKESAAFNEVLFLLSAALVSVVFLVSYTLSKRISGPIQRLTKATDEVSKGRFDLRLQAASRDEIRSLVESFNLMALKVKERQEALTREKETIERIIKNATTGVIAVDPRNRIATINPAALSILGISKHQLVGLDILGALDCVPGIRELSGFVASHLGRRPTEVGKELRVRAKGEDRTVRAMLVAIPDPSGRDRFEATVILLEDVTEILRSEKLKAWAELSRKIAHEVKNPLTPIKLAVDHLSAVFHRGDPDLPQVFEKCRITILKQVENLRRLSMEFLSLTPDKKPVCRLLQAAAYLKETLSAYLDSPPSGIEIDLRLADRLPAVMIDPELLGRALVNLMENAIQALPEGGRIIVSAEPSSGPSGEWLRITIADTGTGVEEEAQSRLFEPYFSTKGTGTGLGLAIARKIVTDHGGTLRLDSGSGPGASFSILLPGA